MGISSINSRRVNMIINTCKICNKEFHRIYGIKNNNKGQLEEFLVANET